MAQKSVAQAILVLWLKLARLKALLETLTNDFGVPKQYHTYATNDFGMPKPYHTYAASHSFFFCSFEDLH